ncbi:MAG: FtsX-like permease family protein, partial [Bacteroidota bacterium]
LKHFRPEFIRGFSLFPQIHASMYRNYLKTMLRQAVRQPLYAGLTLTGLVLGLSAALFVLLYLDFELNYDRIHERADRIYRIDTDSIVTREAVRAVHWQATPANLAPFIQQDLPEVEAQARLYQFYQGEKLRVTQGDQEWEIFDAFAADPSICSIFSFDFIYGDEGKVLREPNQIILSQKMALHIFGAKNPVGQLLSSQLLHIIPGQASDYNLMVVGVFADFPPNVHQPIEALISAQTDPYLESYYFNRFGTYTYVLLSPDSPPATMTEKLSGIYDRYLDPAREPVMTRAIHRLVPLADIHLQDTEGQVYLWIFGGVGLLLLLIAVISYVNLATARAGRRAREVGVRKVLGGRKRQLVSQFLAESMLYSFLALVIGVILVQVMTPAINRLLELELQTQMLKEPRLILAMLGLALVTGILGGAYPAFLLSNLHPISVLNRMPSQRSTLRKALLTFQFVIVVFVICCASTVYQQLGHLQSKDLGFDSQGIIRLQLEGPHWLPDLRNLKEKLMQNPAIQAVGSASFLPGTSSMGRRPVSADGAVSQEAQFVRFGRMDEEFAEALGLELVDGRYFDPSFPSDSFNAILVNQTFVELFGLEDPVGQAVRYGGSGNPNYVQIIGVFKDFHQSSWHHQIEAQIFTLGAAPSMVVKLDRNDPQVLAAVEATWRETFPSVPFEYSFASEQLREAYQTDMVRKRLFTMLSVFTLAICFLGLFGLVGYLVSQRVKEISIRRILGARGRNILALLSKEFLALVCLAAIPGIFLATFFSYQWLDTFAAQVNLNYLIFLGVLAFLLLLTIGVSGIQTFTALRRNPADGLRQE